MYEPKTIVRVVDGRVYLPIGNGGFEHGIASFSPEELNVQEGTFVFSLEDEGSISIVPSRIVRDEPSVWITAFFACITPPSLREMLMERGTIEAVRNRQGLYVGIDLGEFACCPETTPNARVIFYATDRHRKSDVVIERVLDGEGVGEEVIEDSDDFEEALGRALNLWNSEFGGRPALSRCPNCR